MSFFLSDKEEDNEEVGGCSGDWCGALSAEEEELDCKRLEELEEEEEE